MEKPRFENQSQPDNLQEISEERRALRQAIAEARIGQDDITESIHQSQLSQLRGEKIDGIIKRSGGISAVSERLKEDRKTATKEGFLDEFSIEQQMGSDYVAYEQMRDNSRQLATKINQVLSKMSLEKNPSKRKVLKGLIDGLNERKTQQDSAIEQMQSSKPRVARANELVTYKRELHGEGHIAMTPSVAKYVEEIEIKMLTGKPMFLHGPTGTGKTSLARLAAHKLTGRDAEMVYCNQQTRESNIWGKQGIKVTERGQPETVDILGPLARAVAEGKPIIFDEFNSLEEDQMRMVKGIFGYEPGDEVPITGNGKIKMAPGFQMIMTANLKSAKHPDRKDLPDEMKREFEQNNLKIGYNPKEESADIMLTRLMSSDGSVDLSWYDVNVTLPKLAEVMESIQAAYVGEISSEQANNLKIIGAKRPGLKSFVMTHGTIEAMIDQWNAEVKLGRNTKTFAEFIDERLKTALTFDAYTEDDRVLAAKIFASKGFLKTVTAEELGLPKETFKGIKIESANSAQKIIAESEKVAHINLKELIELDPFSIRNWKVEMEDDFAGAEDLKADNFVNNILKGLGKLGRGKKEVLTAVEAVKRYLTDLHPFMLETCKNQWNYDKEQLKIVEKVVSSPDNVHIDEIIPIDEMIAVNSNDTKREVNKSKTGELYLNSESIDFETVTPFIPEIPEKIKKLGVGGVMKYINETYKDTHILPDFRYYQYLAELGDKYKAEKDATKKEAILKRIPKQFKEEKWYLFPGSAIVHMSGEWCAPVLLWNKGDKFSRGARKVDLDFQSSYRVVLFER